MNRRLTTLFAIAVTVVLLAASAHAGIIDTSELDFPLDVDSGMTLDQIDNLTFQTYTAENNYTVMFPMTTGSGDDLSTVTMTSLAGASGDSSGSSYMPPMPTSSTFSLVMQSMSAMSGDTELAMAPPTVPEPATMLVLGSGFASLFFMRKR